ncbi:hypothetical protein NMY22_g15313 [Coprinellus aureogranulatus]|nr:hypothetical protein NMY22_g15313 [Coprinellus aureogranulatus]
MWEELRDSPVSQLLRTSPIIERNIAHNEHLFWSRKTTNVTDPFSHVFAVHVRRGDFEEACLNLANWKSTFYGWNQLPYLPDRFTPAPGGEPGKNTPENIKAYYARCLPVPDTIIQRINDARDEYEKEVYGELDEHHIHTLYILTNDRSEWLANLKSRLEGHGWRIVTSSDLVHRNSQEKDVAMATDMDLARRAAIFLGNGWSSFTSNILHRRLVDKKIPISNRFF